ncbi:MAG TPA: CAP domain-containing protein [Thermoleophilaceae bacterium]|nr:CAP domain-containing protein [Thermoleophilaceae bacterium]
MPSAAAAKQSDRESAAVMVDRINSTRAKHDLPSLRAAPRLMRSARRYAAHLMRADAFEHGPARITGFRASGEMLAFNPGWRLRTSPVVRMWLGSPGHRALMLSRSFGHVGVSPARGRFGGALTTIWVVQLGRR